MRDIENTLFANEKIRTKIAVFHYISHFHGQIDTCWFIVNIDTFVIYQIALFRSLLCYASARRRMKQMNR